ncbi:MAG: flavin reductase family protein [Clostridiales bacterium]|nr:flavin reductase family protein [Clostridiales bacterium]
MKREIDLFDYANEIMRAVKTGVLLTTKADERINSMTISWGTLGIEWGRPIFTTFVREGRFTNSHLEKNPEFTINVAYGNFDKTILGFCGTKSGRDVDKIKELGLTLVPAEKISVPAIMELPLTLECKVIYTHKQEGNRLSEEINKAFYPQDVDSSFHGANKDYHIAYCAEIVSAYILE